MTEPSVAAINGPTTCARGGAEQPLRKLLDDLRSDERCPTMDAFPGGTYRAHSEDVEWWFDRMARS